ncbi:peptidase M75 superfamily protein [Tenacibaculum discolor]|uniref:Imelysin family protein n=1 Tax=Tenacibaculum discolor TaxID=361581 RepID=A0A2G1BQ89_9FLAO|nr:imelysin family protein [Tenacibaculum discolor]MDP2541780.1 imelysin family protein [Tenacibaculum discolor]PHN96212.1 peptidase M75 superfamily protein [Tenacibaculum discolor]
MIKKFLPFLLLAVVVYACSSDNPTPSDGFDRGAMLTHLADNIIIASFEAFDSQLTTLGTKATSFTDAPNATTLTEVRTAWLNAYKAWQHVEMFNIGKAEELGFVNFFNIYPLTVADVESNISNGTYDLNSSNNHDAQGFPALDYLLYGVAANDTAILEKYTTDANAANYKKYITDVIAQMSGLTTTILNDWKGSYRDEFVASTDNTASSSLNKLVNDFIFYYEKGLRANKFGIPAGNFSSTPLPEKVEAYYNRVASKALALEALIAVQDFFNGNNFNAAGSGISFKSYLEYLKRGDLVNLINTQFNTAETQVSTLNDDFYQQINTDNTQMTKSFDELQKVVVYLKVDMLQAFNVSVDYVDADGD